VAPTFKVRNKYQLINLYLNNIPYFIEYSPHFFALKMMLKFPVHYTWKVADKGFKMASIMSKLAMINSCELILEK
jgi:hypothetical protein